VKAEDTLMIVPTRGRPHSVAPLVKAWRGTGSQACLLLALDEDDPTLEDYERELFDIHTGHDRIYSVVGPRLRMVGTLNLHATTRTDKFAAIGFMGDDHRPRTAGWDQRFATCLSAGAGIVYGNDLLVGEKFPTAVMMTSDIIQTLGYMAPPAFVHLCVDLVWKDWGGRLGRITYLDDVVIEHVHPAVGKATLDAGYKESNSREMVARDSATYYNYRDNGGLEADLAKLKELL
jgi:hypothetical protein